MLLNRQINGIPLFRWTYEHPNTWENHVLDVFELPLAAQDLVKPFGQPRVSLTDRRGWGYDLEQNRMSASAAAWSTYGAHKIEKVIVVYTII